MIYYGGWTDEIVSLYSQYESGKTGIPEERPVTKMKKRKTESRVGSRVTGDYQKVLILNNYHRTNKKILIDM